METILILSLLLCLLFIFLQDWKYREIHIALPFFIYILSVAVIKLPIKLTLQNSAVNIIFFFVVFTVMVVYMSVKNKKLINPFQNYFGLGDVLFYCSITPFFEIKNFILFFISSMIFAIILQVISNKNKTTTVPLAGFSALLLVMCIITNFIFPELNIMLI